MQELSPERKQIARNSDVIRLFNLVFHAFHGVEESERENGQRFEIDVEVLLDLSSAGSSDDLADTVDYANLFQVIEAVVIEKEFSLVEALAEQIAQAVLGQFDIEEITVRVRKPHAPIRGLSDGVEIEITRP